MTWGSELWFDSQKPAMALELERIEFAALRKITGAYRGSNNQELGWIANVEPITAKLDDLPVSWVARALRPGDKLIREVVDTVEPRHKNPF